VSDRAPATFTIYRVRGKEQLVAELLEEHGFGTDWASYTVRGCSEKAPWSRRYLCGVWFSQSSQ
jgi:hypothetical protein